tara:strand:+ start:622 stop:1710 length:1089 start_codon:yes stop_codon:yes gene_type:complete
MTIASVRTDHYLVPLPVPLSDSMHGEMTHFDLITVRLTDSDGAEGMGYTYTVGSGGAAVAAMVSGDLAPSLVGEDGDCIERLWERMWWRLHFVGRGGAAAFAIAAIDIALWDLKARKRDLPLWRLLGGHRDRVPAYAGGIDLQFPLDKLLKQTEDNLARGFRAIKMKVGRDRLSEDVERVGEMRRMLGEDFPLMVDANMRWSVDQAIAAARALAPHRPYWIEEPTIPDDIEGQARIVREGGAPIAAGENLHSLYEFRQLIAAQGVTFPEPDAATLGGITAWMKVAALAEAYNLPVTSHGVHDIHVHLLAAVPNSSYLETHGFGLDRFMAEPLVLEDGEALAPNRPGLGITFDWKGLESVRAG